MKHHNKLKSRERLVTALCSLPEEQRRELFTLRRAQRQEIFRRFEEYRLTCARLHVPLESASWLADAILLVQQVGRFED